MKLRDLLDRVWSTFSPVGNIHSQADIMNIEPTPSRADQRAPMVARHSLPDQRAPLPSSTQRLACHSAPLAKLSQTWAHALERVSPALALERPSRSWVLGGKLLCAPDQTAWPHEGERAVAISMALARRCAVGRQLLEMQQTTLEEQSAQRHRAPSGTERTTESSPNEQQERQSFGCVDVPAEQGQALIVPAVPGIVSTHGLRLLEEWAAAQEALGRAESRDTASGTAPTYSQHVQGGAYPVMPSQTASSNCDTAAGTGAGSAAAVGVEWWTAFLGARGQLLPAAACAADFLGCSAFTAAFTALQLLRLAAALEALSGGGYGGGGRGRATADAREVAELLPPFAFLGKVRFQPQLSYALGSATAATLLGARAMVGGPLCVAAQPLATTEVDLEVGSSLSYNGVVPSPPYPTVMLCRDGRVPYHVLDLEVQRLMHVHEAGPGAGLGAAVGAGPGPGPGARAHAVPLVGPGGDLLAYTEGTPEQVRAALRRLAAVPRYTCQRQGLHTAVGAVRPYLALSLAALPPAPGRFRVERVVVETDVHDQGWTGRPDGHGGHTASWTWAELQAVRVGAEAGAGIDAPGTAGAKTSHGTGQSQDEEAGEDEGLAPGVQLLASGSRCRLFTEAPHSARGAWQHHVQLLGSDTPVVQALNTHVFTDAAAHELGPRVGHEVFTRMGAGDDDMVSAEVGAETEPGQGPAEDMPWGSTCDGQHVELRLVQCAVSAGWAHSIRRAVVTLELRHRAL